MTILEMRGIVKEFPGVKALDGVTFDVRGGEVHALVGENGAGKSTLMKILGGIYPAGSFEGKIILDGRTAEFTCIKDSERAGIAVIHQELAIVAQMSVCENLYLGCELARHGVLDRGAMLSGAKAMLSRVGLAVAPDRMAGTLGTGEQQLLEIAKALSKNARILVLDEPTASLSETEARRLFGILGQLRQKGVSCIYISHRLEEVIELSDRVTVLRDGKTVETALRGPMAAKDRLVALMVGRPLAGFYPRKKRVYGKTIFEVRDWSADADDFSERAVRGAGFSLREGEILGLAGLVGAGRSEFVMSLFGAWGSKLSGTMRLCGRELDIRSPRDAIREGICLATEDRKRYGLVLDEGVRGNITLPGIAAFSRFGVVKKSAEARGAGRFIQMLGIKTPSIEQKVRALSGGNQQKIVLAKWLMTKPRVLILDEPTRGIDVGARAEIYGILARLVDEGVGVIVVSSDMQELFGLCDTLLVMAGGRVTATLEAAGTDQRTVMRHATGEIQV
ncbi:MAG: D-xylose ABC transporter ATP-binding protein [Bdellovibrionales bacterium RIFOXYD1_FULL_53_11]|nr:MAG: D-xylose ABC transporter ATP-binding protein [Bdellovibrionales bacterium RIFOXYD1_FULL_53_11]